MASAKKTVILIVEDDEVLLRALYLEFHGEEYAIATAPDGVSGFEMAQRIKPDIILLDIVLPKMNGFDFLKLAQADASLKQIPVIVLSNLCNTESIEKAKELGALDYFVKSNTDLSALRKKVDSMRLKKI